MKSHPQYVRIYGERHDGQWSLICLNFSLAVQDESLEEAKAKLNSQIASYVKAATVGVDSAHADYLLSRSAPLKYWAKFYLFGAVQAIQNRQKSTAHIAARRPMSAMLAAA